MYIVYIYKCTVDYNYRTRCGTTCVVWKSKVQENDKSVSASETLTDHRYTGLWSI